MHSDMRLIDILNANREGFTTFDRTIALIAIAGLLLVALLAGL